MSRSSPERQRASAWLRPYNHVPTCTRLDHQPQNTLLISPQPSGNDTGPKFGATVSELRPSCPNLFHPQENACPVSTRTTVWRAPQTTCNSSISGSVVSVTWRHGNNMAFHQSLCKFFWCLRSHLLCTDSTSQHPSTLFSHG